MVFVFRCPEIDTGVFGVLGVVWKVRIGFEAEEFEVIFITGELGATIQYVGFGRAEASNGEWKGDEEKDTQNSE